MDLTVILNLKCPECNSPDLMIIGVCEGGVIACECQSCEDRCGFHLTELMQACLEATCESE